jgi:hypothetical protein
MSPVKKPRGRPKQPWEPFETELLRRLETGEALATVEAEAKYLAKWAKTNPEIESKLDSPRIRERIKKRFGGSKGYKNSLEHFHLKRTQAARTPI